jgi:hypothetical protein
MEVDIPDSHSGTHPASRPRKNTGQVRSGLLLERTQDEVHPMNSEAKPQVPFWVFPG